MSQFALATMDWMKITFKVMPIVLFLFLMLMLSLNKDWKMETVEIFIKILI